MTIQEMEQALIITPGDKGVNAKVQSSLNIVKICGPIVEVDDYVRFVHFTAKEYLFSPQVKGHIDEGEAATNLASCCIMYLCQDHHDPEIPKERLTDNLLEGIYRLHDFASNYWFKLVEKYCTSPQTKSHLNDLVTHLKILMGGRKRHNREAPKLSAELAVNEFQCFGADIGALLTEVAAFRIRCSGSSFSKAFGK